MKIDSIWLLNLIMWGLLTTACLRASNGDATGAVLCALVAVLFGIIASIVGAVRARAEEKRKQRLAVLRMLAERDCNCALCRQSFP